jgi:hypothetical protein
VSYRDMTFCTRYPATCGNEKCPRALTDAVREDAKEWWGDGGGKVPIAVGDMRVLHCGWTAPQPKDGHHG